MPEDDWTWLKLAQLALVARLGARGAEMRLQRAWEEGALTLRGVASTISETREFVEIPASEAGHLWLDCPRSRLLRGWGRRRLTAYHSVQVRKADVERLAREAAGNHVAIQPQAQAESPDEAAAVAVPEEAGGNQATLPLIMGTGKAATIAWWQRRIYPAGRPGKSLDEMETDVRQAASTGPGKGLGVFSRSTFKRAVRLAWPPA
jgi:hypothetical protein